MTMTNPNTHPSPAVIADLRVGLDFAKRLREHLPGDAPELQQADETIAALEAAIDAADSAPTPPSRFDLATVEYRDEAPAEELTGFTYPTIEEFTAVLDELATLRADNDARGVLIEELRAGRDAAQSNFSITAEALEYMRDERNQAHAAYSRMWGERDAANAELAAAKLRNEALAAELDTVRSERDAARKELTDVKMSADLQRAANHHLRTDRDRCHDRWQQTLRALNAALGEP